jgi:hypothetical protein
MACISGSVLLRRFLPASAEAMDTAFAKSSFMAGQPESSACSCRSSATKTLSTSNRALLN